MSLDHQMEQHRLAVEKFREDVKAFDERKKELDEKIKALQSRMKDCDSRISQFEEAQEKFRLLANKYDNVLVVARILLEEADKEVEVGMIPYELLTDLQKALSNGN